MTRTTTAALVALLAFSGAASAETIEVQNQKDRGPGSLRKAIAGSADGDKVKVPPGDYELKAGPLIVATDIAIKGSGKKATIISAKRHGSRIFEIDPSAGPVSIEKLTISGGRADLGGGVLNEGDLTLRKATVRRNEARFGGGIASSGSLRLESSAVSGNTARGESAFGAGIFSDPAGSGNSGDLILIESKVTQNKALGDDSGFGGGIVYDAENAASQFLVDRSTIAGNKAVGTEDRGFGGGIFMSAVPTGSIAVDMVIARSTLSGNVASGPGDGFGGGMAFSPIVNSGSVALTIENSTVFANRAAGTGSAGRAFAGGLYLSPIGTGTGTAPMSISSTTISKNKGIGNEIYGGGLYVGEFEPPPVTRNSIVAGNTGEPFDDCTSALDSAGGNLERRSECEFDEPTDIQDAKPRLRKLDANGGPTRTAALRASSPAVDAGLDGNCPATDQRGVSRPQGPFCDIGAFELKP